MIEASLGSGILERTDLRNLLHWDDQVVCTSRANHNCSVEATHISTSSINCPDPVRTVFWCAARFGLWLIHAKHDGINCKWCHRPTTRCWNVRRI